MTEFNRLSASEAAQKIAAREITSEQLVRDCLARIEARDKEVEAWQYVDPEAAIAQARALDKGPVRGPIHGVPLGVKDIFDTYDMPSEYGCAIYKGNRPRADAATVARARHCGMVILGKTVTTELATHVPSRTHNPHNTAHTPGGSSAGSAAAVADCMVQLAIGTQTVGSTIRPASFCGVVGITPTYGLVSRYGLIDYANSLDKIGTIGKTVWDAAFLLSRIAGHDHRDSTSLQAERKDYTQALGKDIKGVTIGVPKEYFENINNDVEKAVWNSIHKLESLGASWKKISLPNTKYALSAYYIIATAEASTNLSKLCGMRYGLHMDLKGGFNEYFSRVRSEGFGEEAKRRIMLWTFARMSGYRDKYYLRALKVRTLVINDFKKAFKGCDVLAAPTMPILPPKFSEIAELTPLQNYQMDVLTVPANLAGVPMVSVPCGFSGKLPIGMHLIADHLQEEKLLQTAHAFERAM